MRDLGVGKGAWSTLIRVLLMAILVTGTQAHAAELTTQDYIDIEQLYAQYNHAIDAGDAEGWAATFTPVGTFNQFAGREALEGFIRFWREKRNGANRRHWNANLRIVPTAEGASATVMLMLLDIGVQPPTIAGTGMYTDRLVKTAQGWRFKSREVKGDAPPPKP